MPDREKVIRGLECCIKQGENAVYRRDLDCPYQDKNHSCRLVCWTNLNKDAIALLKEQEPQTVIVDDMPKDDTWFGIWFGRCPNCKEMLTKKYHKHFCGNCGQEVKWSD